MLNLPKRKSTFNFYESFSDLVFCSLVMFLVLILFLAMSVSQKQKQAEVVRQVAKQDAAEELRKAEEDAQVVRLEAKEIRTKAEQEAEQARQALIENQRLRLEALALRDTELAEIEKQRKQIIAEAQKLLAMEREEIAKERGRIDAERKLVLAEREKVLAERAKILAEQAKMEAALDLRRSRLTQMQRDLDQQRRLYEQALGVNRFTGLPSAPRLVVAYDWQPTRISIHPVPAWLVTALNTTPAGLDPAALNTYYAKQRDVFLEIAKQVEPLSPAQYRALVRSISVGREPVPEIGIERRLSLDLVFAANAEGFATTEVGRVIPGGNGDRAGLTKGDILIALDQQPVTQAELPRLLKAYKPGDEARLLIRRAGKPKTINVIFGKTRLVEMTEAYRTDLSMVVSGALDTDYTYLWEPARADALRRQFQEGKATGAVWQGASRWDGRDVSKGRPVLKFDAVATGEEVLIGGQSFTLVQFRRVLESIGGGSIVVEYQAKVGPEELPQKLYTKALRPTGFVVRAPQLDKLIKDGE